MSYNLFEKIKELLKNKGESIGWLTGEMDRSERWFYNNRDIKKLSIEDIAQLTRILDFDFMMDFNNYLKLHPDEGKQLFHEPPIEYKKPVKKISVQVTVTAVPSAFKDFEALLNTLKKEGEKHGFEIE